MPPTGADIAARAVIEHPLPAVFYQLLTLNETVPGAEAALPHIIRLDPELEARMRSVSRAQAPWAERTADRSLEQGIAALGFRRVHSAALMISTIKALPIETTAFDYLDFWRYSVAVAYISASLGYARRVEGREYAYAAGLFHDIGRLIMEESDPEGLSLVRTIQMRGEVPWHEVERSAFGFSSIDLSLEMVRAWHLPPPLIDAISGLVERRRSGLAGTLRDASLAARALRFATSTGRKQDLSDEVMRLVDRYYGGPDGLRLRVNALLETSMIATV